MIRLIIGTQERSFFGRKKKKEWGNNKKKKSREWIRDKKPGRKRTGLWHLASQSFRVCYATDKRTGFANRPMHKKGSFRPLSFFYLTAHLVKVEASLDVKGVRIQTGFREPNKG